MNLILRSFTARRGFEKIEITKDDVNRPGLQLAGFLIISTPTAFR